MLRILTLSFFLFAGFVVQAISYKEYLYLHNSNQCNNYFDYVEDKYGLPRHLLRSISAVETGRWNFKAKSYMFWPWAVNKNGRAYYYASKEDAVMVAKDSFDKGQNNFDVGCMQINLLHHPDAFRDLDQAFEPKDNIEYAASFLKRNYNLTNDWYKAVAVYHSQNEHGRNYADKVFKIRADYEDKRLFYNLCTSLYGEIMPCDADEKGYLNNSNDKLYFAMTSAKSKMSSSMTPKKSARRLKSNMIPYSIYETN